MRNILLKLSFCGTNYHGWQVQDYADTVQGFVENALSKIFSQKIRVNGCSRTDAGVHANEFFCNFKTENPMPCDKIIKALNGNLPFDISVLGCFDVAESFHARYDCEKKEYIYKIWNTEIRNPFFEKTHLHYKYILDEKILNEASKSFLGTHDFAGFCSVGSQVESTVRTVKDIGVERQGDEVIFHITADGFLYNMVRIITGTLLYVAQGKIQADDLSDIIESRDRNRAGITAPAHGLYLNKVSYGVNL